MVNSATLLLLVIATYVAIASAHIQFVCVSVYDDYQEATCNKALLWIGTYNHGAVQGGTIPGRVTVSVGGNNYVTPDQSARSPFLFQKYCLYDVAPSTNMAGMRAHMTGANFLSSCPSGSQNKLRPQLAGGAGQDPSKFKLRCTNSWDPSSGNVVLDDTNSYKPNCGQTNPNFRQWAFVELEGLDTTTGGQDITFAMTGVDQNFAPDGSKGCRAPLAGSTTTSTDLFNNAFFNSIRMNVKPSEIYIPGCGLPCAAYPSITGATHGCTASSVPSGTNCNVKCSDAGKTAAGSYVICNGGNYTGKIECTSEPTATGGCTKGKCADIDVPGGDTIVSTPGCGDRVKAGTCCDIACASSQNKFSQGFVCAEGTQFKAQNGTKCETCTGGSCTVSIVDKNKNEANPNEPDTPLNEVITPEGVVCVSGANLNPIRDKIILIERTKGTSPKCADATSAYAGQYLQCNSTTQACEGESPSSKLYVCAGALKTPDYGKICICDADAQGGCPDLVGKFVVDGPITRSFTFSPTTSPTSSPTFTPTPAPIGPSSSIPHTADGTFTNWFAQLQYPKDSYEIAEIAGETQPWQQYEWSDIMPVPEVRFANGGPNPESTNVRFDFGKGKMYIMVDQIDSTAQQCNSCAVTIETWSGGGSAQHQFFINGDGSATVSKNGDTVTDDLRSVSNTEVGVSFGPSVAKEQPHNQLEVGFDATDGNFGVFVGTSRPHWFTGIATSRGIIVEAVSQKDFEDEKATLPPQNFCIAGSEVQDCVPLPPVDDDTANVNPKFKELFGAVVDNPATTFTHTPDGSFTGFTNTSLVDGITYEWKGVKSAAGRYTNVFFDFRAPESQAPGRRREASNGSNFTRGRLYIANDWKFNDQKPIRTNCYNLFKVYTGNNEAWLVKVYGDATVEVVLNGRFLNFTDPDDLLAQEIYADGAAGFNISPLDPENKHSIFELALYASPGRFAVEFHDPGPRFACDVLETEAARFTGVLKTTGGSKMTTCDKQTFDKISASIAGTADADDSFVDDWFWSKGVNDFCQPVLNENSGCEALPPVSSTARTNTNYKTKMNLMIKNDATTFTHTVDGAFTGYNASVGGSYEWQGVKPAVGRFTNAYFDFRATTGGKGYLYLLNDWKYNDELPVQSNCYNLFKVHTGNSESWQIKVFGDKTVEVILNGRLLDFDNENDTLAQTMLSAGAIGFNMSPLVPDAEHSIFELMITASAGRFAVEFHDPGPRFACEVLETEPARFTGIFKEEGGSIMTACDLPTYEKIVMGIEDGTLSEFCQADQAQLGCNDLPALDVSFTVNADFDDFFNVTVNVSAATGTGGTSAFTNDGTFTGFTPGSGDFTPKDYEWETVEPVVFKFGHGYLGYDGPSVVSAFVGTTNAPESTTNAIVSVTDAPLEGVTTTAFSNETTAFSNETIASPTASPVTANPTTQTLIVTAAGGNLVIDGEANKALSFESGFTYIFDLSDSSLALYSLRFSTTINGLWGGGTYFSVGTTVSGNQGQAGAFISIVVSGSTPTSLYYFSDFQSGMGGVISVAGGTTTFVDVVVDDEVFTEELFDHGIIHFLSDWAVNTNFDNQPNGFSFIELTTSLGDDWTLKIFHDPSVSAIVTLNGQVLLVGSSLYKRISMVATSGLSIMESTKKHALYEVSIAAPPGRFVMKVSAPGPAASTSGTLLVHTDPAHVSGVLLEDGGLTLATVDNETYSHINDQIKTHKALGLSAEGGFYGLELPGGSEYTNVTVGCGSASKSEVWLLGDANNIQFFMYGVIILIFILILIICIMCCCPCCCCVPVAAGAGGKKKKDSINDTFEPSGALFDETNMDNAAANAQDDEEVMGFGDTNEEDNAGGYLDVDTAPK